MSGFKNRPKILRGAFVEYGLSLPPMFVVFQFNPEKLSRTRSISYSPPNRSVFKRGKLVEEKDDISLRNFHKNNSLLGVQRKQQADVNEENISFDIRLDATEKLSQEDFIAGRFGIAPELSALEMMVHPKDESILGSLFSTKPGYSFTRKSKMPMILFIWGLKRVLPVNINSLNIDEIEYSTWLNPIRAEVKVDLTVIEGANTPYKYSKVMKEAMAVLNLRNFPNLANVVVPG